MNKLIFLWSLSAAIISPYFTQSQCIDESLINPDASCLAIWMPVCGCDNITYSNDCQAQAAGVTQWTDGECGAQGDCIDESLINPDAICPDIWMPVCGCDNITHGNDCQAQAAGVTSWTIGECPFNHLNELDKLDFNAYPNPMGQLLYLEFREGDFFRLRIYDAHSKLVYEEWIQGTAYQIETVILPKGLYMIELQDEALRLSRKILIK